MIKEGLEEESLKIYELYLQRHIKEGEWAWARFKIYFGFNYGILVVLGLLLKPYLYDTNVDFPSKLLVISLILSILGIFFSVSWFFICKDNKRWQQVMNYLMERIEKNIIDDKDCALFHTINEVNKREGTFDVDVVDMNMYIPIMFIFIYILLDLTLLYLAYFG